MARLCQNQTSLASRARSPPDPLAFLFDLEYRIIAYCSLEASICR